MIKKFEKNTAGRDIAVGDIHGHFTKLQQALDRIGFDPAVDRLFSVGDIVDRGPESALALGWLDKPWFHAAQGNHEGMAICWADGKLDWQNYSANGGAWNLGNLPQERMLYADAFRALPIAMEVETDGGLVGIVHADCPRASWQQFTRELETGAPGMARDTLIAMAQWSRQRPENLFTDGVAGVRAVVVGHTPMRHWTSLGNVIFIDTGAWLPAEYGGGEFTLLDLATLTPVVTAH